MPRRLVGEVVVVPPAQQDQVRKRRPTPVGPRHDVVGFSRDTGRSQPGKRHPWSRTARALNRWWPTGPAPNMERETDAPSVTIRWTPASHSSAADRGPVDEPPVEGPAGGPPFQFLNGERDVDVGAVRATEHAVAMVEEELGHGDRRVAPPLGHGAERFTVEIRRGGGHQGGVNDLVAARVEVPGQLTAAVEAGRQVDDPLEHPGRVSVNEGVNVGLPMADHDCRIPPRREADQRQRQHRVVLSQPVRRFGR